MFFRGPLFIAFKWIYMHNFIIHFPSSKLSLPFFLLLYHLPPHSLRQHLRHFPTYAIVIGYFSDNDDPIIPQHNTNKHHKLHSPINTKCIPSFSNYLHYNQIASHSKHHKNHKARMKIWIQWSPFISHLPATTSTL